jgi:hypothetical protein
MFVTDTALDLCTRRACRCLCVRLDQHDGKSGEQLGGGGAHRRQALPGGVRRRQGVPAASHMQQYIYVDGGCRVILHLVTIELHR